MSKAPSPQVARTIRFFALPVALNGVVACAAILGIDDRSRIDEGPPAEGGTSEASRNEAAGDAPTNADGGIEASADADVDGSRPKQCIDGPCTDAGGTCSAGVCKFACGGAACPPITCPTGNDCEIACDTTNSCDGLTCKGGSSCTFKCTGTTSCKGFVACESERCQFDCSANACKEKSLSCDASVCIANCIGDKSCEKGLDFRATTYCGITCSGPLSCGADNTLTRCDAPDSSIDCSGNASSCYRSVPSCTGPPTTSSCAIRCNADPLSCSKGYCCEAGVCNLTPGKPNACP